MSVTLSDITHLQSADTNSSGGAITSNVITSGVTNNVWPDISDASRTEGIVLYRKTFIKNNHATDSLLKPTVYIAAQPTNATLVIGLGVNSSDDSDSGQGNMSTWTDSEKVALVASIGGDTRTVTIYGLDNSGTPVPTTENVVLTGTSEVLSTTTYSKVWAVWASSTDAVSVVTVKQGSGGSTRGTIGAAKKSCWLWVEASSKGSGVYLPNLDAGQNYGIWRRLTVAAGAGAVRPNSLTISIEETI